MNSNETPNVGHALWEQLNYCWVNQINKPVKPEKDKWRRAIRNSISIIRMQEKHDAAV